MAMTDTKPSLSSIARCAALAIALAAPSFSPFAAAQATLPDAAVMAAVEAVLKAKPELVRDALAELERREQAEQALREREAMAAVKPELVSADGATVLGNPLGDVTLVEFIDYRCGYCRKMAPGIDQLIAADPKLRVVVKHLPVLGAESVVAAQLALAAGQGQAAQALHHAILAAAELTEGALRAMPGAQALFDAGLGKTAPMLAKNQALADQLRIQGTPALIVGDFIFRGAVDPSRLAAAIEATRANQIKAAAAKS